MAETSWPSPAAGRAVTDRGHEELLASISGDGLVGSPADTPLVYGDASGMQIKVRADRRGLVRGYMWSSGAVEYAKGIGANVSGSLRNDLVVLRLTRATWNVTLEVKPGQPGAGPPVATTDLSGTGVYEVPVATVRVQSGVSQIQGTDVVAVSWWLDPDPTTYWCLSTARPPAVAGRRIREYDTGREYVADASPAYRLVLDDRSGLGELGPFTLPTFSNINAPTTIFDQYVTCRPAHFHNITAVIKASAASSYSMLTLAMEIDTVPVFNSGATMLPYASFAPTSLPFRLQGWKSGQSATQFRLRLWVSRYSGGNISAGEVGSLSIVDNGAGAGAGLV